MRLYCSMIYKLSGEGESKTATRLCSASDLTAFGFFQQNNIREFMYFSGKMLAEKTQIGNPLSIKEQNFLCHVYTSSSDVTGVLISDLEYPSNVALAIVAKFTNNFSELYSKEVLEKLTKSSIEYKPLEDVLIKYQDPASAAKLLKLQQDVNETREIMFCNLESLLQRDEKLDDLIVQSEELTLSAKAFYVTAKKSNKCCTLL